MRLTLRAPSDHDFGPDAFEAWRDRGGVVTRAFDITGDFQRFHGVYAGRGIGGVSVTEFDFSELAYSRTAEMARRDGLDGYAVQVVGAGGMRDGMQSTPGMAVALDYAGALHFRSAPTRGRSFFLPRHLFGPLTPAPLRGSVVGAAAGRLLSDYAAWLMNPAISLPLAAEARSEAAVAAVISAVFSPQNTHLSEGSPVLRGVALERAHRFISANAAQPITQRDAAAAVGVSERTLYRLLAPQGGFAKALQKARLEKVRRDLADPSVVGSIGSIAVANGFSTPHHFSRLFSGHFGFSARNLRPF